MTDRYVLSLRAQVQPLEGPDMAVGKVALKREWQVVIGTGDEIVPVEFALPGYEVVVRVTAKRRGSG